MATEREPEVSGADVASLLAPHVQEDDNVSIIAEKAHCSTRTIWRRLEGDTEWLSLKDADDLLTAVGESINSCHLKLPDGTIEEPWFGE